MKYNEILLDLFTGNAVNMLKRGGFTFTEEQQELLNEVQASVASAISEYVLQPAVSVLAQPSQFHGNVSLPVCHPSDAPQAVCDASETFQPPVCDRSEALQQEVTFDTPEAFQQFIFVTPEAFQQSPYDYSRAFSDESQQEMNLMSPSTMFVLGTVALASAAKIAYIAKDMWNKRSGRLSLEKMKQQAENKLRLSDEQIKAISDTLIPVVRDAFRKDNILNGKISREVADLQGKNLLGSILEMASEQVETYNAYTPAQKRAYFNGMLSKSAIERLPKNMKTLVERLSAEGIARFNKLYQSQGSLAGFMDTMNSVHPKSGKKVVDVLTKVAEKHTQAYLHNLMDNQVEAGPNTCPAPGAVAGPSH